MISMGGTNEVGAAGGGRRKCGRKKSSKSSSTTSNESKKKNKEPQRGMGMAQLEWHRRNLEDHGAAGGATKLERNPNIPAAAAAATSFGVVNTTTSTGIGCAAAGMNNYFGGHDHQRPVVLDPNGLFLGHNFGFGSHVVYPAADQQFSVLQDGGGVVSANSSHHHINTTCEMWSRDMSSSFYNFNPNIKCPCPPPAVCPKKKRFNDGETRPSDDHSIISGGSWKNSYGSLIIGSSSSTTSTVGKVAPCSFAQAPQDFCANISLHHQDAVVGYDYNKLKAAGGSSSRNMVMEYHEFFPEKEKSNSIIFKDDDDWLKLGAGSDQHYYSHHQVAAAGTGTGTGGGEPSINPLYLMTTTTNTTTASSSSIDLSLKLSY